MTSRVVSDSVSSSQPVYGHAYLVKVASLYALFSTLWIFASDQLLALVIQDPATAYWISILKGWLFIGVTTALLYRLINRFVRTVRAQEAELRKTVETLEHAEKDLRTLIDGLPIAVATSALEANGRITFLNEQFVRTFGYTLDDIPTVADWGLRAYPDPAYRTESFKIWDAAVARAIAEQGRVETMELRVTCKDGRVRDTLFTAVVLENQLLVNLLDMTERRQAEKRLAEQRRELDAVRRELERTAFDLTENIPVGTYTMVLPPGGAMASFSFLSKRFLELTGLNREEAQSDPLGAFACIHPDDFDAWLKRNAEAFARKQPFFGQTRIIVNGEIRWITAESIPRDLPDGSTVWEGVLIDVTDRVRMEENLEQARDAAESATRAKSEFLAHMSHEIRTPMNAVLGLAQVLNREPLSASQRDMVQRIQSAGQSLLAIINDILDLSKIEAGQLRLESQPFDPGALLAKLASILGQTAHAKGLRLRLETPSAGLPPLVGDGLRLEQVLLNLTGNAIKFTEQGDVIIRVERPEADETSIRLRFEVRDTGIGIAPEALAGLFDPFVQAEAGISRRFGGTGLGLPICKRLVESMGGAIGAESQLGQGSTFWFELTFQRGAEDTIKIPTAPPPAPSAGPRLTGVRVLVVDDSALNRDVVERALGLEGANVTLAADGQQALQQLRARPAAFDAVLMDIQMPVMDGLTATQLIRGELGLTDLPVIAFTAGVLAEQQRAAREAGANDVLAKPVDLEQLAAMLLHWVPALPPVDAGLGVSAEESATGAPFTQPPPAGRLSSGVPDDFPEIPGIDRVRAAQTLDGDPAFFMRLLNGFITEFADAVAQISQDLAQGERKAAAQRAHTLRGNAGNLGALELMVTAGALEEAILRGETELETGLESLGRQMEALEAASAPWRAAAVSPTPAPSAAPPLDAEELVALRDDLSRHNLKALRRYEALKPALAGALGEASFGTLDAAIHDLRFEEALALLDQTHTGAGAGGTPAAPGR